MLDTALADSDISRAIARDIIPVIAIAGGLLFAATIVFLNVVKSVSVNRAREATKREVAAYVAEGSINPDDAVRMLVAGTGNEAREIIAKRAADGVISPKKADQLIQSLDNSDPARA
ncbi:MAG: hypothetical protein ED559_01630 [Phycisphaera sp.]|nr:MAG: hypothetical protein ED559_01630 [Phycisphaera sp.]